VLQRKANREVPRKQNLSPRLIWSLAHQPTWFGGVLAITAGFLLQAVALGNGQLSVVEPLLVLELPATLILASWVFRSRLGRREWACVAAMAAALAGILYTLSPSAGQTSGVRWYTWLIAIGANLAVVGTLVAFGRRGPAGRGGTKKAGRARQAGLLGVAAGSAFGLTAALMKAMTGTFAGGIVALLTHWELYGMIATGAVRPDRVGPVGGAGLRRAGPDRLVRRTGRRGAGLDPLPLLSGEVDDNDDDEEGEPAAEQSAARR
jgi:drug/metabolite transporter (DMT)-like permease